MSVGLLDRTAFGLLAGVGAILVVATVIAWALSWRFGHTKADLLTNLRQRIYAWWIMIAVLFGALALGELATIVLFGLLSLIALREFVVLAPGDLRRRRSVLALMAVAAVAHYTLVALHWYGFFSVFIPVYAFLFLPAAAALLGRTDGFLQRAAITQWALMVCVFAISFAPALLNLPVAIEHGREAAEGAALGDGGPAGAHLLLFLVVVVQGSDVFQYVWGTIAGRHPIAPSVSPNKTWEGFIGGLLSATALGAALSWLTPFTPAQAGLLALVSCLLGFAGGLVMSSIKRDRGAKDFGHLIPGHGGIMDRLDSLCFAAPVFFHLVRYFFT